jgi:tripeptidyl-peptidase I
VFNPGFPASCPYVTVVGATQISEDIVDVAGSLANNEQIEEAVSTFTKSGGGFSNLFALPSYQSDAVSSWFASNAPFLPPGTYNDSQATRGFPDVAVSGAYFSVMVNGASSHAYGTSASAQTFGSIITLINEARFAAGKGAVGFLNPALYSNPDMFKDVTKGSNPGCGTDGFSAVAGWDPLTGLGTPVFDKMRDYFLSR